MYLNLPAVRGIRCANKQCIPPEAGNSHGSVLILQRSTLFLGFDPAN